MLKRLFFLSVALFCIDVMAEGREVTIPAGDGVELEGSYFAAEGAGPAILLLHQCNAERWMWDTLAPQLAERGFHVLSFDYRGYGDSALPEGKERGPSLADVEAAHAFLAALPNVEAERIGLAGASCGGPMEILFARGRTDVKAMVFLSTYLQRRGAQEAYGELRDIPALFITSSGDGQTAASLSVAFAENRHPDSRMIVYKGEDHGYPLFDRDPHLERTVVDWFAEHLQ